MPDTPVPMQATPIEKVVEDRIKLIAAMYQIIKNPLNSDYYAEKALQEIGLL